MSASMSHHAAPTSPNPHCAQNDYCAEPLCSSLPAGDQCANTDVDVNAAQIPHHAPQADLLVDSTDVSAVCEQQPDTLCLFSSRCGVKRCTTLHKGTALSNTCTPQ